MSGSWIRVANAARHCLDACTLRRRGRHSALRASHFALPLAVLGLAALSPLRADEVRFGGGERLAGTLVGMADGKVSLRSAVAGEVSLPWAAVTDLRTTEKVPVRLTEGRTLTGVLAGIEAGMLRIEAVEGVQWVKAAEVARIGPEAPAAGLAPQPAPPRVEWLGNVSLGMGALSGNSHRQDYNLGAEVRRRTPLHRWHLTASLQHGQSKDRTDVARARGGLTYSRNLRGRHYYSAGGFLRHDDMMRLRLSGYYFLSRGYRLIDAPNNSSNLEIGGTYINDNYRHQQREDLTGLVRSVTSLRVLGNSTLKFVGMVWPSTSDIGHLRGNAVASLEVPVGPRVGILLGLTEDYDSRPVEKNSRHDLQTNLSLTYKLK